jgi:putative hydrolase of the HAD superfamily
MVKGAIKAIIFDLGNVLLDFDHRIAANRIAQFSDKNPDEIFSLFFDSQLTGLFEEGRILPEDFFAKVKEMLNLKLGYEGFLPIWNEIFYLTEKNLEVYDLAKRLKKSYRLALLSNINVLHLEYLKKKFPVFDAFHSIIVSCQVKTRKPDPLIYQKTLEALGISAQNTFYTDDRIELVDSANRLGIKGFVFKGIQQLNEDLTSAGINPN